jgi:hypothetical protein
LDGHLSALELLLLLLEQPPAISRAKASPKKVFGTPI